MEMDFFTKGFKSKLKNAILKTISWIMLLLFVLGVAGFDSEGFGYTLANIFIFVSALWLVPFGIINGIIEL